MDLAQQHNFPQAEQLLLKYANHLLESKKYLEAVELYRKVCMLVTRVSIAICWCTGTRNTCMLYALVY